jgi:hypothetical protein
MTEGSTNANNVADSADKKARSGTEPAKTNRPPPAPDVIRDFEVVYGAEYADIVEGKQWEGASAPSDKDKLTPSVSHKMTGLALSGGGIRSASFCLGVLQAFNATGVLKKFRYLSTVSGGGYIGTSINVAMADEFAKSNPDNAFPFGLSGLDVGETDATRHLRDNSRYLLQNGIGSALSALVIYLRGVVMNVIIVLPFLLLAAALLVAVTPDTRALAQVRNLVMLLPEGVRDTGWPFSIFGAAALLILLVIYAFGVSILPILKKPDRQRIARIATFILILGALPALFELHFAVLRIMFEGAPKPHVETAPASDPFGNLARIVAWATPIVAATLPFVRKIAENAVSGATTTYSEAISKWTSRLVLIVVAAVIPLLLWLSMLQLAYWAIGVTACTASKDGACTAWGADNWEHAPSFIATRIEHLQGAVLTSIQPWAAVILYVGCAVVLFAAWLALNVNSNSLHQLYRDRLGSAFLFKRERQPKDAKDGPFLIQDNDTFCLADINQRGSLYHLINTALNLPGSNFANRRGRNADFFFFSRLFTGSEATGYVDTRLAEKVTDGLNVGTAMAISGAAAAPNMGMASMRPLSATIALLNVRLGRWLRHPLDIVKYSGSNRLMRWWRASPGPLHLLSEAFFKSGADISERKPNDKSRAGFVFLTDGGHIENLGVYELLRRRCSLIVAVDAEADPDFTFSSLAQLERFARIDFGTRIVMDCASIGDRSRAVSDNAKKRVVAPKPGPHVALGLIDYPPVGDGKVREKGALIYIKASVSGDESGYVTAYKAANPAFPQESTMEQLFSEEQFEVYRALGEHIGRRLVGGDDPPSVDPASKDWLTQHINELIPEIKLFPPAQPLMPEQAAQMCET